jgi:polyphenol oxidase
MGIKNIDWAENIQYGISQRKNGSMKMNGDNFDRDIKINRERFFESAGIDPRTVLVPDMSHGTKVAAVNLLDIGNGQLDADAMVSDEHVLTLAVTVADCMGVYFFDPLNKAIGIAHCGWRGIYDGILGNVIAKMSDSYGTKPELLEVKIGPHIQACHYEVQEDVARKFRRCPNVVVERAGKIFVSLSDSAAYFLEGSGVCREKIELSDECTYCSREKYFSYRRDKPAKIEAMIAYIRLAQET